MPDIPDIIDQAIILDALGDLAVEYAVSFMSALLLGGDWAAVESSANAINQVCIAVRSGAEHELAYYSGAS